MVSKPNISVNKLAEYIASKAARQRAILAQRKYPDPDFNVGMYHKEAAEAVAKYLADGADDPTPILNQAKGLEQLTPTKVGTARRINANLDALDRFAGMLDKITLCGATPEHGTHNPPKLVYHGVNISVRPEIILRGKGPKGKSYVGALKCHFSSSHPHGAETAGYVSAAVQEYCRQFIATDGEVVNAEYCQVLDIASGTVFPGVKATLQRLKDIEAECMNIAALWASI
ncbi:MAG TPA: hypothetical protein VHT03_08755 [Rhizomicrobium sp.]|jgi:hypothetical protein|nr:hypothetical protein [Rhizomicrobium sp.]